MAELMKSLDFSNIVDRYCPVSGSNRGFMPKVGRIAETGQIDASDFRAGNVAPARDNMAFIEQCQQALPKGVSITHLRIDTGGATRWPLCGIVSTIILSWPLAPR